MNITNIAATRIGSHAHEYLSSKSRAGAVVSTFRHGFNVFFDEASDPGFVTFQANDTPLHPWAISVESVGQTRVSGSVVAESNRIQFFSSDVIVDLSSADVAELKIKPWTQAEASRAMKYSPVIQKHIAMESARQDLDPFQSRIDAILERWQKTGNPETLLNLVGLGSGSTPSGDDVLVGILAGFAALSGSVSDVIQSLAGLRSAIDGNKVSTQTSFPSAQMLLAAVEGRFVESLCTLSTSLGSQHAGSDRIVASIQCLVTQGVTSGLAFLIGFSRALQTQFRRETCSA